tara:strand:+ start:7686 stop:8456 length:771 start_codon:yes stop_codon:yes gene_type:complete
MMSLYTCENCGFTESGAVFEPVMDIEQRFTANTPYTDCECPICGALAYPTQTEQEEQTSSTSPIALISDQQTLLAAEAFTAEILSKTLDVNLVKKKDKLTEITLLLAGYPNGKQQFLSRLKERTKIEETTPHDYFSACLATLLSLPLDDVIKTAVVSLPKSGGYFVAAKNGGESKKAKLANVNITSGAIDVITEVCTITEISVPASENIKDIGTAMHRIRSIAPQLFGDSGWYVEDDAKFSIVNSDNFSLTITNQS